MATGRPVGPNNPEEQPSHPAFRLNWRPRVMVRMAWMMVSIAVVQTVIFGLSVLPAATFWELVSQLPYRWHLLRTIVLGMAIAPAYLLFALSLMVLSALSMRWTGWRTPPDAEMKVSEVEWPLVNWARYMVSIHVVRLLAGSVLRTTPLWTFYLRLNGARLGRGVYINSLALSDHNLLEFEDYVVIGDSVHLSGHTVERGVVKTGRVRLGRGTTVGLGSVVGIGVETGPRCQIGALSLVPKYSKLEGNATYVGSPVRRLSHEDARQT
jgi:acetyltransferase-like isoleucine patch superfamily enzyme